jgi:Cu(I)/Ag(I) efflux system protein CusF
VETAFPTASACEERTGGEFGKLNMLVLPARDHVDTTMDHGTAVVALSLAAATTACGNKPASTASADIVQGEPASPAVAKRLTDNAVKASAHGRAIIVTSHGIVIATDERAGTITLDHGPIPQVGWQAGKTIFRADPAVVDLVMAGEDMDFTARAVGTTGVITAIQPRP